MTLGFRFTIGVLDVTIIWTLPKVSAPSTSTLFEVYILYSYTSSFMKQLIIYIEIHIPGNMNSIF